MNNSDKLPIKIMYASASALFRRGFRAALQKKEDLLFIADAENGKHLLQLLENELPDIVITDIRMPVMDAFEVVPIIRTKYPSVKIIIHSFYSDPTVIIRMMELGANAYLTADVESDIIYEAIIKCHTNGFYIINLFKKAYFADLPDVAGEFTKKEIELLKILSQSTEIPTLAKQLDLSPRTYRQS